MSDASDCYASLRCLTPSQSLALEVLVGGGNHEEAALAAGVHRVTVSRWLRLHPAFIAAWNETRTEVHREMLQRLRVAMNAAAGAVLPARSPGKQRWDAWRRHSTCSAESTSASCLDRTASD